MENSKRLRDLEALRYNLMKWRKAHHNKRGLKYPESIRDSIIKLSHKYGVEKVCRSLEIANTTRWKRAMAKDSAQKNQKVLIHKGSHRVDLGSLSSNLSDSPENKICNSSKQLELRFSSGESLVFTNYDPVEVLRAVKEFKLC